MGNDITSVRSDSVTPIRDGRSDVLAVLRRVDLVMDEIKTAMNRAYGEETFQALDSIAHIDLAAMAAAMAEIRAPAPKREIQDQLAILGCAFPNTAKRDLTIFGRVMLEDVMEQNPSRTAMIRACRRLRRTCKFLPTISELLDAIEEEESDLRQLASHVEGLPRSIEYRREEHIRWLEDQRRWHDRIVEECAYALGAIQDKFSKGKLLRKYSKTTVAEAEVKLAKMIEDGYEPWPPT